MNIGSGKKFMVLVSAVALCVLGAAHWWTYAEGKRLLAAADERRIGLLAEVIRNSLKAIMLEGRGVEFQKFIDSIIAEDIEVVRIFSENGLVLNSTIPHEVGRKLDQHHVAIFLQKHEAFFRRQEGGHDTYSTFFVIKNDWPCQKCHGSWGKIRGILDLEVATRATGARVADLRTKVFVSYLLCSAVLILLIGLVYRRMVRDPLERTLTLVKRVHLPDRRQRNAGRAGGMQALAEEVQGVAGELELARERLAQCRAGLEKQQEQMASLGEVAAAVAHEIKNPLAGISGALQVMAEDIPDDSPRKTICNEILAEISRLDTAVKDFLLYAKPPAPNLLLTDIHAIIEKVRETITLPAARAGVRIETALHSSPSVAMVDPDQIEKVFYSIAMQGINAMPNGGVLVMRTDFAGDQRGIGIDFSDTGQGIPDAHLEHVFKPFFSTRHLAGGLRLAICKAIIEKHGGTIGVWSEYGSGTSFHIVLPAAG